MRTSQPQTIYLSDYKVPAYLVDTVDLRFELFEDGRECTVRLSFAVTLILMRCRHPWSLMATA